MPSYKYTEEINRILDGKKICMHCLEIYQRGKIADLLEKQNILLDKLLKTEETHK